MASSETTNDCGMVGHALSELGEPSPRDERRLTTLTPPRSRSKFRLFTVMAALFMTVFIAALNSTIVATAVPTICSELNSASGYSWIGGVYLLGSAAAAPVWAKLSDIWGRKPILLTAVAMYLASSIVCALSKSMDMLILGRALQGVAGGGLIQIVKITISDLYSLRLRTLYLGLLQLMWAVAAGVGPVLGGVFTQSISWRWNFWINVPISGTTFFLLLAFLDVHNPKTSMMDGLKAIDWFGSLSIMGVVVMVLLGLNFGGTSFPWDSPKVICLIVFGCLMIVLFLFSEKRLARYPLMPLGLFRNKSNIASLIVAFTRDFVYIGVEYYLPLYFQSVKEASPLRSGLLILPITITEALVALVSGIITHRTGLYVELMWIGVILLTIGNGLYIHLNPASSIGETIGFQLIEAAGAGLLFNPPLVALQALVSQQDTATATATMGFLCNLATSFSVVIGGVVFQNGMNLRASDLKASGLPSNITEKLAGDTAAANIMIVGDITDGAQKLAVKEALAWSLRNIWILCTCMAACGACASAFISKRELSSDHVETRTGLEKHSDPIEES